MKQALRRSMEDLAPAGLFASDTRMAEAQTGADAGSRDDPALEELRGAYDAGNLVLFAGAGISAAAGLPSGKRLAELSLGLARTRGLRPEAQHEMEELIG